METAGFMAESVEKIFHLSEQVRFALLPTILSLLVVSIKLHLVCFWVMFINYILILPEYIMNH